MMMLRQDLRYGLRMLVKSPGFTFIAILAMALGIGANTAIFSVVNAVLLRQLPYKEPGRLAMVWQDNRRLGLHEDLPSYANFDDWRTQNHVFEDMAAFTPALLTLASRSRSRGHSSHRISSQSSAYGPCSAATSRWRRSKRAAIGSRSLSYGLWKRRFGGDPNVVGRTLEVDGSRRTVIGVMPQRFGFPSKGTELWAPLTVSPQRRVARGNFWLRVVGRLKQDVSLAQARAEMDTIAPGSSSSIRGSTRAWGCMSFHCSRSLLAAGLRLELIGPVAVMLTALALNRVMAGPALRVRPIVTFRYE